MIEGRGYVEGCGSGVFCLPRYDPSQTNHVKIIYKQELQLNMMLVLIPL